MPFHPMHLPRLPHSFIPCLVVSLFLVASTGCRKSEPPASAKDQDPAPNPAPSVFPADAKRRPEAEDLARYLRGNLPPTGKLVDFQCDPPVPLPNTSPGSYAWVYNVRVTIAPTEDVLDEPEPKDAAAFQAMVAELDALAAWGQAYARSPYAARYPGFVADPAAPTTPKLLAVVYPAGKPTAPLYGKIAAEWQLDHWEYTVLSMQKPANTAGKPRSEYPSPVLVQGRPEIGRFLAQVKARIDDAKPKQMAIEAAYRDDLFKATQPGTIFRGQLRYHGKAVPVEVHLAAAPTGSDLQREVQLEVRLPDAPPATVTYLARRAERLPLRPAAPADGAAPALTSAGEQPLPKGDLTLSLVSATGRRGMMDTSVPSEFMHLTHGFTQPTSVTLSVHDGRLEGSLNGYSSDNASFVLSTQQSP